MSVSQRFAHLGGPMPQITKTASYRGAIALPAVVASRAIFVQKDFGRSMPKFALENILSR